MKSVGIRLSQTEYYEISVDNGALSLKSEIDGVAKSYTVTEVAPTKSTKNKKGE